MFIKITYVGTLNSIHGMWCGFKPEGLIIEEERLVLYPEEGYVLQHKTIGNIETAVWIADESEQNDWEEIPEPEEPEEVE